MVRRSSVMSALLPRARVRRRRADGTPVVGYVPRPGRAPVGAELVSGGDLGPDHVPVQGSHAHDFYVLVHVESGTGTLRVDSAEWRLDAGDVCVVAPGEVVHAASAAPGDARLWVAFFTSDALGTASVAPLAWRQHPLLAAFGGLDEGGSRVLRVPEPDRAAWSTLLTLLATETGLTVDEPAQPGAREAATAALTLLLVSLARLRGRPVDGPAPDGAEPAAGASGWARDPLVTAVLDAVEAGFQEPISTRDVARSVGYTTGHLTTVVRERTGRTVLEWLTERRMIEARRLLSETDLPVAVVADRTGYRDATYLVRRFREQHGVTPLQWRRQNRS
jgi:AraC-like DNA-binding protein